MTPTPEALAETLRACVADASRVRTSTIDRLAFAHDASHFLLRPRAVVAPRGADEVARLMRGAAQAGVGLTFRSGGTSLSGQAGTGEVLADVRRYFTRVDVLDDGARVRVQPGVTVDEVNARLAPHGTMLGPDPASSRACTVGGVVANNSSGMACGTTANTYRTLDSLVAVLPSGTVVDTGAADADDKLRLTEPALYTGLIGLRDRVRANPASVATIERQFSMKNTMGYGLNSFTDFARPVDILTHLLIGSEGTLAFVAEATFRTVPVKPHTGTALVVFDDLFGANQALPALVGTGAATLELMDAMSLRAGQAFGDAPAVVKALRVADQAALLVEYRAADADALAAQLADAAPVLAGLPGARPTTLTRDPAERAALWTLRNGLYTSVAGARKPGTTALLEDVVVPVAALASTCAELTELFDEHRYADSVIFGHAKDGNIHFMITDRFEGAALDRYRDFTAAMVDLVLGHDGSLKAEHGTGRVMAPFVERQYGPELYDVMVQVKRLFDPAGMLNDSVVITDDPDLHLRHIKPPAAFDADADRCSECGYCEPVCPARALTLTPRQRIALRREVELARARGDQRTVDEIERPYVYAGVRTCAVDGMCSTACPMRINTGDLVRGFRRQTVPTPAAMLWTAAAKHWRGATALAGAAMDVARALAPAAPVVTGVNEAARAMLGSDNVPLWSKELPGGGAARARPTAHGAAGPGAPDAVYLPACVNRMFGPADAAPGNRGDGVQAAVEALCRRAGLTLLVPDGVDALCCGTPWSSKGVTAGQAAMGRRVLAALREATDGGRLPVVCDASSCTEGLAKLVASDPGLDVDVVDAVQFVADRVLGALGTYPKLESLTLHQTCSSTQLGLNPALLAVAEAVATTVNVPVANGCCAFAGDRGLLHPELTRAATRREAAEVAELDAVAHASCNRTCEVGLTRATGRGYRHVLELLAEQVAKS